MLQFMSDHIQVVNAVLNAAMVVIWVVYLQIFLISHRRQSRSVIHIDLGAAKGAQSRCLVTNLSSGALYVQGIVADLVRDDHMSRTIVTDRDEISEDETDNPMSRTNRGTLQPGQTVDIGSLNDLVRRARIRLDEEWFFEQIDSVTISVVAISGQAERIVGASKTFSVTSDDERGTVWFNARNVLTKQMRPLRTREEFNSLLRERKFQ